MATLDSSRDDCRHAPATERNREPILVVLRRVLPAAGLVLEVASGTGQHAAFLAGHFPRLTWQPSDIDPGAQRSIAAWIAASGARNVLPPVTLDSAAPQWPVAAADAVVSINMIHIAPWEACVGLMGGAARILPPDGVLYLYGPFRIGGAHTAPSNEAFDADLRRRNASWGVRDLDGVCALAETHGLALEDKVPMPANNVSVVFRRVARFA